MELDQFGQFCALMAAVTWAAALVMFKRCGETVSPLPLNLFKNTVSLVLLSATLIVLREGPAVLEGYRFADVALLIISGVIGIALADTIMFRSLNLIGVGLLSIVDCLYSPSIILCSWLFLSEDVEWPHYAGAGLILVAVLVSSGHSPLPGRTRAQLTGGVLLGVLAIIMIAVGIMIAKPVLNGADFPVFWASTIRIAGGAVALAAMTLASPARRQCLAVFRPAKLWWWSVPAAVLGTYLAMIFWIAGFKYTTASVAGILNQTSVVFALLLAAVILKEKLTRRKLVSVTLAMSGLAAVLFADSITHYFAEIHLKGPEITASSCRLDGQVGFRDASLLTSQEDMLNLEL